MQLNKKAALPAHIYSSCLFSHMLHTNNTFNDAIQWPVKINANHEVTLKCPCSLYIQLDESTARRQLKSPRSLSGRSIHLTYILSWKFKVKVMAKVILDDHIWALEFNWCLLFVSWQSDHFWLRYSKFYIWPWKFKVKVMAKVKPDGHIWALEFNRYVCFSFRGNRTIYGWDIANSIFDLEKSRSRSRRKSTKI